MASSIYLRHDINLQHEDYLGRDNQDTGSDLVWNVPHFLVFYGFPYEVDVNEKGNRWLLYRAASTC